MKTYGMDYQIADNRKVWSGIGATVGRHTLVCKTRAIMCGDIDLSGLSSAIMTLQLRPVV